MCAQSQLRCLCTILSGSGRMYSFGCSITPDCMETSWKVVQSYLLTTIPLYLGTLSEVQQYPSWFLTHPFCVWQRAYSLTVISVLFMVQLLHWKKNDLFLQELFNVVTLVSECITNIAAGVVIPSEVRSHSADWGLKLRHVTVERNHKFQSHSISFSPENLVLYGSLYLHSHCGCSSLL